MPNRTPLTQHRQVHLQVALRALTIALVTILLAFIPMKAQNGEGEPTAPTRVRSWDSVEWVRDSTLSAAYLAIAHDSTAVDEYAKIAEIYKVRKRRDLQLQITDRMVSANPSSSMAHMLFGDALFDNEFVDSAIASLKNAVLITPGFVRARTILAEAYMIQKQFDSALFHLDTAIEYNPRYAQARIQRASLLTRLGRDVAAVEDYRAASELLPLKFDAWFKLGQALVRVHDYRDAADVLEYAMMLDSTSADALFMLAEATEKSGRWQEAIKAYERFYLQFPTNSRALEAERRARSMGGGRP